MDLPQIRLIGVLAVALGALAMAWQVLEPDAEPLDPAETALVWQVEADDVEVMEIERAGADTLLFVRDARGWRIEQPQALPGDRLRIEALLADLARIERGIPIPDADPEALGLGDPPTAVVRLTDALGTTRELVLGRDAPVGSRTYARTPSGAVVAVPGELGRKLGESLSAWRDKAVLQFDPADVRGVRVTSEHGVIEVTGQGSDWWLTGYTRASPDRVEDLILGLRDLRFDGFMDDEAVPDGIAEPTYEVVVTLEGGGTQTARFGSRTPMGVITEVRGAHGSDDVVVGAVYPDSLALLGQGPKDVGDDRAFPLGDAREVRVRIDGVDATLTRRGDSWVQGEQDAQAAVDALRQAGIAYRREPVPPVQEPWGRVTVVTDDGSERVVELGQREGSRWRVARDTAGGEHFLVPVGDLQALQDALTPASGG